MAVTSAADVYTLHSIPSRQEEIENQHRAPSTERSRAGLGRGLDQGRVL